MSTKSPVDLRSELAELVKRKAEIAVSTHVTHIAHTCIHATSSIVTRLRICLQDANSQLLIVTF